VGANRPLARTQGFVTEEVDGELRVYDEAGDVACVLNATAAAVWARCDGKRTVKDLVRSMSDELGEVADEDLVLMALDKLAAHGLLLSGYEPRSGGAERLSRRRFFRRAGIAGATAMAAPVVYSMAEPEMAFGYTAYYTSDRRLKRNIRTLRGRR
jgi:Coenzyme PQQ synthesis protein D (PqqD)